MKDKLIETIQKSIMKEFFAMLVLCFSIAILSFAGIYITLDELNLLRQEHIDIDTAKTKSLIELQDFATLLEQCPDSDFEYNISLVHRFLSGECYVTTKEGTVLNNNELSYTIDVSAWKQKAINPNHQRRYVVAYPFERNNQVYYILQDTDLTYIYIYSNEWIRLTASIIALSIFFGIFYHYLKKKTTYIAKIGLAVDQVKHGDLNVEVPLQGSDELFRIAQNMNVMQKNLLSLIESKTKETQEKNELISSMAHDIKTPITIILGYLDIIIRKRYHSENDRDAYLERAYQKAESLRLMIMKLFDTVRFGSTTEKEMHIPIHMNLMVKQAIAEYEPLAIEQGLSFTSHLEDIREMQANPEEIMTIIDNILGNALKYCTPNGHIDVRLHKISNDIVFEVSNSSKPVNDTALSRIFDEFYRLDQSRNSSVEGNGLGLYLVKNIVSHYHGSVWAEYQNHVFTIYIRLHLGGVS